MPIRGDVKVHRKDGRLKRQQQQQQQAAEEEEEEEEEEREGEVKEERRKKPCGTLLFPKPRSTGKPRFTGDARGSSLFDPLLHDKLCPIFSPYQFRRDTTQRGEVAFCSNVYSCRLVRGW